MNKYKVYFELYGKKMVKEIMASSDKQASEMVMNDIIFHKVEKGEKVCGDDILKGAIDLMRELNKLK